MIKNKTTIRPERTYIYCQVREEDPAKWQGLRDILIKEKKYGDVSIVNFSRFKYALRTWPKEFIEKIKGYVVCGIKKSVRLVKKY